MSRYCLKPVMSPRGGIPSRVSGMRRLPSGTDKPDGGNLTRQPCNCAWLQFYQKKAVRHFKVLSLNLTNATERN